MPALSKRQKKTSSKVVQGKLYGIEEAAALAKECATAKFDETIELAFFLGVDPRHAEQMVRGSSPLPHGTGKVARVVVFARQEAQIKAALEAGAIFAGSDELVKKVEDGWTDFDAAVAAPDMMGVVGKLGKVLGPRGLMPSPKAGSVTPDVANAVREIQKGKIDYRVDKNANIHVPIGKASFTQQQISENASAIISSVVKARPAAVKGTYLKSCAMSSTMGPGFRLDPSGLVSRFSN